MNKLLCVASLVTALCATAPAWACSAFLVEAGGDGYAVAKSYDWDMAQGVVLANRRGVAKRALILDPRAKAHAWTSTFASVTFNQYGAEMPNGGMNEKGLVVEVLWLNASKYPAPDARPVVNELQWIQWALDTQATTAELVAAAPAIRVAPAYAKVHYFACDASRACATFEYVDGKLSIHHGADLPYKALTNHTYDASEVYMQKRRRDLPKGRGSLERFARVSRATGGKDLARTAFHSLDSVSQDAYSVWNIVYLPAQRQIQFRTHAQTGIKRVDTAKLALGCGQAPRFLDVQEATAGDVTGRFRDYTTADNARLIDKSLGSIAAALPAGAKELLAAYPSTLTCAR